MAVLANSGSRGRVKKKRNINENRERSIRRLCQAARPGASCKQYLNNGETAIEVSQQGVSQLGPKRIRCVTMREFGTLVNYSICE